MAAITLSSPAFFRNGVGGVSAAIGVESTYNRVARYSFSAPSTGASSVSLSISGLVFGAGTRPGSFRFHIGTDPTSHINAGSGSACTGTVSIGSNGTSFSGSASILLLPDTTYYLFIFPNTTDYGWFSMELAAVSLTSSGGSYSVPTLSASSVAMGSAVTIKTNRYSTDFTHTLTYTFGSISGTIATGVTDSYSWTPPLSLASNIPSATSGVCAIYCTTFNSTTQVGTSQLVKLTLTVPASVVPTAKISWTDTSGTYDKMGAYVQNVSKLTVDVSGTGIYGSSITGASCTLDGSSYYGAVLTGTGAKTLVGTVTDSRGRKGSASGTLTVAAYSTPQLTLNASRCTADGTADDTGEYCNVTISGTTVQVNGKNTAALSFTYGSTTKSIAVSVGSFTHSEIVAAPSTATLNLSATLSDKLASTTRSMTLSVGYATMDFMRGGKGIAFGATSTKLGFECAMDAYFTGAVLGRGVGRYNSTDGATLLHFAGRDLQKDFSTAGLLLMIDMDSPSRYAFCYYHYVDGTSITLQQIRANRIKWVSNIYGTVSPTDESGNVLPNVNFTVIPLVGLSW